VSDNPIVAVLRQHRDRLMAVPGVVGIGQGEHRARPCIKVFVAERTPALARRIPSSLEGYAVVIEETGSLEARDPA
jgi:transposase